MSIFTCFITQINLLLKERVACCLSRKLKMAFALGISNKIKRTLIERSVSFLSQAAVCFYPVRRWFA